MGALADRVQFSGGIIIRITNVESVSDIYTHHGCIAILQPVSQVLYGLFVKSEPGNAANG
jgi:hypothetical protein